MPNINDIQQEARDSRVSVSILLRDAKTLATNLQQTDFIGWIDKELDGYPEGDKPLEYRIVKGIPQAYNGQAWVSLGYGDVKTQEIISEMAVGQSVAELEELLKYRGNYFILRFPPSVANLLREHFGTLDFYLKIGRSEITKILNHVRNTIFNWCIGLEKKGISGETKFTTREIKEAETITPKYHIGHIDHFEGNIGDHNVVSNHTSIAPPESLLSKFLWYVIVALLVLIAGNVLSGLALRYFVGIGASTQ